MPNIVLSSDDEMSQAVLSVCGEKSNSWSHRAALGARMPRTPSVAYSKILARRRAPHAFEALANSGVLIWRYGAANSPNSNCVLRQKAKMHR